MNSLERAPAIAASAMPRDWVSQRAPAYPAWKRLWSRAINLLFPDNCRLCELPLLEVERYPVCTACLRSAEPMVADYFCQACHTAFATQYPLDNQGLCAACRSGLRSYDRAYSYGFYEGNLRGLIHLFKYDGIETLARPLAGFLLAAVPREQQRPDCIVPVPMHWWRRWRRGYNQTELLAAELSRRIAIPWACLLRRRKSTPPQAGLSHAARRRNVAGVFHVRQPQLVRGRHILLLDDVLTTGATASACAAALKNAGAARVSVLTLARVDKRMGVETADAPRHKIATTAGG